MPPPSTVEREEPCEATWVAASPAARRLLQRADRIARVGEPILIGGERGTGKSMLAERIHRRIGGRGPFVVRNCATFAGPLAASALFGHDAGAYTDAKQSRRGAFELAHGGTLFLDEIAELPSDVQAMALHALEGGWIARLGSEEVRQARFQLITATNRDLEAMIAAGTFRADVLDRVGAIRLQIPPLRERPADILALAQHCAGLPLDRESDEWLVTRRWDGNSRTLAQTVWAASRLAREHGARSILLEHLLDIRGQEPEFAPATASVPSERDQIVEALLQTDGNRARATAILGLKPPTLRRKIRLYGIHIPGRPGRPPGRVDATSQEAPAFER